MARLINVSDDVYGALTKMKGKDSYSVLLRTLVRENTNKEKVLSFFGKGAIDGEKIKELSHEWKKWSEKYV